MEKWERRKGGGEQKKAGSDARVWRRGGEGEEAASLALSGVIGSWTANLSSLINSSRGDCSPAGACWEKKTKKRLEGAGTMEGGGGGDWKGGKMGRNRGGDKRLEEIRERRGEGLRRGESAVTIKHWR